MDAMPFVMGRMKKGTGAFLMSVIDRGQQPNNHGKDAGIHALCANSPM